MRYRKSISYAPLLRKCKSRFWWPNPGLSHFSKILSKTLIFLKLRGAGKFTSWFFDVLGPTHHPVSKLKNDTIFLSILILDLLLTYKNKIASYPMNLNACLCTIMKNCLTLQFSIMLTSYTQRVMLQYFLNLK